MFVGMSSPFKTREEKLLRKVGKRLAKYLLSLSWSDLDQSQFQGTGFAEFPRTLQMSMKEQFYPLKEPNPRVYVLFLNSMRPKEGWLEEKGKSFLE